MTSIPGQHQTTALLQSCQQLFNVHLEDITDMAWLVVMRWGSEDSVSGSHH